MNLARGIIASPIGAVTGATPPALALRPSTAAAPAAFASATSGLAPLSYKMPEDASPCAARPAQNTKGLPGLDAQASKYQTAPLRPESPAEGRLTLFEQVYDFENLYRAWLRARRGKRGQAGTAAFSFCMESELIQLQNELIWRSWHPGPYEAFEVHEPKRRMIYAPAFRDRVLHHSLVAAITPIWERVFIPRSYACRVGKGSHAGASAAEREIRSVWRRHGQVFALKGDISKYFESIDRETMKALLRLRLDDPDVLALCDRIIDTSPGETGLPLGNLTSQLFANIYLRELDHWMTNIKGIGGYFRYMDDWVVIGPDRRALVAMLDEVRKFLTVTLKLRLNPKTAVFRVDPDHGRSVDFLGYQLYGTHRRLRQRTRRKGFARARDYGRDPNPHNLDRLTSWYAHARYAEPTGMMRRVFQTLVNASTLNHGVN